MTEAAIIATLVVVVLQIITLSLLRNTRKMVRELSEQKSSNSFNQERRDRDRHNNRRPVQENKNRAQMQSNTTPTTAAVDPVEKSLRDINLKLKNAERDQEFARKKIQDNFSKDNNRRRDNGKGGRDQRRGDRRSNWNDRNSRRDNPRPSTDSIINDDKEEIKRPIEQPIQDVSTTVTTPPAAPELVPNDYGTDDNLQHGRKFAPKRKFQSDENTQEPTASTINEPVQEQFAQENPESSEKVAESEIKFGRR